MWPALPWLSSNGTRRTLKIVVNKGFLLFILFSLMFAASFLASRSVLNLSSLVSHAISHILILSSEWMFSLAWWVHSPLSPEYVGTWMVFWFVLLHSSFWFWHPAFPSENQRLCPLQSMESPRGWLSSLVPGLSTWPWPLPSACSSHAATLSNAVIG